MTRRDPAMPRTRIFGMYNPHVRFPKTYLDRVDVLTIDGRVLDAAAWNVRQLIWRPDLRLDAREVDAGPRAGNVYLGPGWSLEKRERAGDAGEISFVQALTNRAIISASLPRRAVQLVLRASSPPESGPRSVRAEVDGRPAGQADLAGADGYRDITIAIPDDPSRPPVSTITLHFDSGGRGTFDFKLDRFTIQIGVGHAPRDDRGALQLNRKKRPAHPRRTRALLVTSVAPRRRKNLIRSIGAA